jgi:hypothetical protein
MVEVTMMVRLNKHLVETDISKITPHGNNWQNSLPGRRPALPDDYFDGEDEAEAAAAAATAGTAEVVAAATAETASNAGDTSSDPDLDNMRPPAKKAAASTKKAAASYSSSDDEDDEDNNYN